jgi:hypothetical protein
VLLERKAKKLILSMDSEKGVAKQVRTVFETEDRQYGLSFFLRSSVLLTLCVFNSWKKIVSKALIRPFALFSREPIVQLLGLYMAFIYGLLYRMWALLSCLHVH